MKLGSKPGLAAGLAVVALAAPASAAPVTVNLRIEGAAARSSRAEVTAGHAATVDGGSRAPSRCDRGRNSSGPGAAPTFGADDRRRSEHAVPRHRLLVRLGSIAGTAYKLGAAICADVSTRRRRRCFARRPGAQHRQVASPFCRPARRRPRSRRQRARAVPLTGATSAARRAQRRRTARSRRATVAGGDASADDRPDGRATITLSASRARRPSRRPSRTRFAPTRSTIQVVAPGEPLPPPPAGGIGAAPDRLAPLAKLLGIADHQTFARAKARAR